MEKAERKINGKGSITIPKFMRDQLGIEGKEKVNLIPQSDGKIIIDRIEGTCIFCQSSEDVEVYKGKYVCATCRKELSE